MAPTAARLAFLAQEWREVSSEDSSVQTKHLLALQTVEETILQVEANAQSEVNRRQTLRGVKRDRFELVVPLDDDTQDIDLGDVIKVTHARYGLSGGKLFRVLEVQPNARKKQVTFIIWG